MTWAIMSGILGNLTAYEATLADLQRERQKQDIDALFILGDLVSLQGQNNATIERIRSPKSFELTPDVCLGWWEDQCLSLHALGRTSEPTGLIDRYGITATQTLWDTVDRAHVEWMRDLNFGLVELDCLLVHGTTLDIAEAITPETSPIVAADRLGRMGMRRMICGRPERAFHYQLSGSIQSAIATLDHPQTATHQVQLPPSWIACPGTIGAVPGQASYLLYHPGSDRLTFKTVAY
jgi:hypothetical protein